jgi:hypothetical protein
MKKSLMILGILALSFILMAMPLLAAEMVDNPMYLHWAKFKPGTFVTLKMTMKMPSMTTDNEMTYTLKQVTPQKALLEVKTTTMVQGKPTVMPPSTQEIPAKIEKAKAIVVTPHAKPQGKVLGQGEETFTIKDKKVKTKWVKAQGEAGGTTTVTTVWTSEDMPNWTVKSVNQSEGAAKMTTEQMVIDFKADRK